MNEHTTRLAPSVVLVAAVALVITAIATIALVGGGRVAEYAAGSPEATAQDYIQALIDGDAPTAHELLSPSLQRRCEPETLALEAAIERYTAHFTAVRPAGDQVRIDVSLADTSYEPGEIPLERYEIDSRLVLEQFDGEWRIVAASWPLDACDRR